MNQNSNKPINPSSAPTGILNNLTLSGTTLTTNSSGFTSSGVSYTPFTSTISSPLQINGPIIYNNEEGGLTLTYLHEIAVIAITRSPIGSIIKSKMVKTMWVETKNGGSIDFAAGKDPEVSKFESEDIIIKTLRTIKL